MNLGLIPYRHRYCTYLYYFQGVRGGEHLRAPAPREQMQGVRGREHLRAPAPKGQMQGVRGRKHLPTPVPKEHMQGVRGSEHLPAPAHQEQMQGVPLGHIDAGRPGGAGGASACCWQRPVTCHMAHM